MGFGQWYLRRGRITRRTWWLHYTLPLAGLGILAGIADGVLGYPGLDPMQQPTTFVEGFGGPLSLLVSLFTVVPSIASTVTRLHDRGHSAWWLLWTLVPVLGCLVLFVQVALLPGRDAPESPGWASSWPGLDVPVRH